MDRVVVLGIGNVLMGDDGFGPYVARLLGARYELPEAVEVHDGGTPGLDLAPYLGDSRALLVIDTVNADGPPGTVRVWRREELLTSPLPPRTSPHQPGLREALLASELTGAASIDLTLVGVVPQTTELGTRLSPPLAAAVEPVIDITVAELERLGVTLKRLDPPADPDIWWVSEDDP